MSKKPIIGITMGDAAGVGPEIIIKSLQSQKLYEESHPIVIGDAKMLKRAADILKTDLNIREVDVNSDFTTKFGEIACYDLNLLSDDLPYGQVSADAGHAALEYLDRKSVVSGKSVMRES